MRKLNFRLVDFRHVMYLHDVVRCVYYGSYFCVGPFKRKVHHYIRNDSMQVSGIGAMMNRFMNQLRDLDPELHRKLLVQDIKPQFYAFRWITLLLSQVCRHVH